MEQENRINVFFDTEFTTVKPGATPGLISIGCVAHDGREFYAELSDTWTVGECSPFVIDHVLPLLDRQAMLKETDLSAKLKVWIESLGQGEVVLRTDAPRYDWPLVEHTFQFFGNWPRNLRRRCGTIYFENEEMEAVFNQALESFWKTNEVRRHHALVDARSLQFAWSETKGRGQSKSEIYKLVDLAEKY